MGCLAVCSSHFSLLCRSWVGQGAGEGGWAWPRSVSGQGGWAWLPMSCLQRWAWPRSVPAYGVQPSLDAAPSLLARIPPTLKAT